MSGLQIFNAYPRLHIGNVGNPSLPAVFEIGGVPDLKRQESWIKFGSTKIDTTGFLGVAQEVPYAGIRSVAFPQWMTLPQRVHLGDARGWHFLFITLFATNLAIYLIYGLISRRFWRELVPNLAQLRLKAIVRDLWMHIRLRHATGEEARNYNLLQKLAYLSVLFMLLPGMVVTGLAISPSGAAMFPDLVSLIGGRQSARLLHFVFAWSLVAFLIIHVFQVFVAGFVNEMRSILTGFYRLPEQAPR